MEITDREKEINLLLDSLSGIDGDLLMDVEPARPVEAVREIRVKKKSWQRYAALAASLLVLIGAGLVIRLALPGMGNMGTKSADPKDLEMAEYGQDASKGNDSLVPGEPESMTQEIDPAIRGAVLYEAVSVRRPLVFLHEEGQEDSVYSPLLLFLGLIGLDEGGYGEAEGYVPKSPHLSSRSGLIESRLSARERQDLLDDSAWPQALEDGMDQASGGMDLLQDLVLDLTLRVMAEAGPSTEGGSAMVPGVSVYRKEDGRTLARLPAGDFTLYLALPAEGHSPEELLEEEGFLTDLLALEGRQGQAGIRLAPFTVSASHDWYSGDLGEDLALKGRIYQNVRLSVSFESVEPGLCLASMIEFNRPFVFAVSGSAKLPLLAGLIYPPAE